MFTFNICKCLVKQKSWKLISKNISVMSIPLRCKCPKEFPELMKENYDSNLTCDANVFVEDTSLISKIIQENHESKPVRWEEIVKKLKDSNVKNPHSSLLQYFLRKRNADYGADFCNHLIKEGIQLTPLELVMFLKLFSHRKDLINKNKTVIKQIYENIKSHLKSSPAIQNFVVDVIAEVPYCFYDYVKTFSSEFTEYGMLILTTKAFEMNRPDLALQIMEGYRFFIPSKFTTAYLDYLLRMAKENKLSPQMIITLVDFYQKNVSTLDIRNLLSDLKTICQSANNHDENFIWSVSECTVHDVDKCSHCHKRLLHKGISESEFNYMKKDILSKIALLDHSVFLSSSDAELKEFLLFLSNSKPYNVVIDALNVVYQRRLDGYGNLFRLMKHLIDDGQSILVIGKKHVQRKIMSAPILKNPLCRGKVQFFFPSNLSDDDVFVLYATLHGGLGTNLVSADNLSSYHARLSVDQKDIFLRWKVYHQYIFNGVDLIPPRRHLGVPQLTSSPDKNSKKFVWHISYSPGSSKINVNTPLKWVCLQATLRKHNNQFNNMSKKKTENNFKLEPEV